MKTIFTLFFTLALAITGLSQITISQFTGQSVSSHDTHLIWKTMMETKIDYFNIQRSDDGMNFENIGQVDSKMSMNTNSYELNYDFSDANAVPGTSYYRLQIVSRNGFSNYSDVIQISNRQIEGIKIYPTVISNTNMFVETDKPIRNAKLEFFDLSGKKVGETNWEVLDGRQSLQPMSNMKAVATGTYVARLSSQGETIVSQLMIFQTH
ncbi:MAG: T9SS type A sorting domain-containing protein [Bacteroidetes bacterium]|nr:T9SS type A sorting domain-containing protein [Bacteroidota bacterium]